jgi:protein disulfide-isomerase-like protein
MPLSLATYKNSLMRGDRNAILITIAVVVLIIAIFWPRDYRLFHAGVSAHIGNLGGSIELETFDGQDMQDGGDARSTSTLTLFYAPWCPHCKNMMSDWDRVAQRVANNKFNIKITKINCDENKEMAEKYGVSGFPTIIYFGQGMDASDKEIYDGERTEKGLLNFIKSKMAD